MRFAVTITIAICFLFACESSSPVKIAETEPCTFDRSCENGLICVDKMCIDPRLVDGDLPEDEIEKVQTDGDKDTTSDRDTTEKDFDVSVEADQETTPENDEAEFELYITESEDDSDEIVPTNIRPVALVSIEENGQDIVLPILIPAYAALEDRTITFFSNKSYDDDGDYPLSFIWTLKEKPEKSKAAIQDISKSKITIVFDVNGQYLLSLMVTDSKGAKSKSKDVEIELFRKDIIKVVNSYDGSGHQNVLFEWVGKDGGICSEERIQSDKTCPQIKEGKALIESRSFDPDVRSITISHEDAPDGKYIIRAIFKEDCTKYVDFTITPFCASRKSVDITTNIHVDTNPDPAWKLTGTLKAKDDILEWPIHKTNGVWQVPVMQ